MKAKFSIICLLLFSSISYAQFTLTPKGFVSTSDTSKNFIVIPFESLSQKQLFDKTMMHINTFYVSPKDVISTVDSSSITINGVSLNSIRRTKLHVFDLNYTINIQFKSGKIRISIPSLILTTSNYSSYQKLFLVANNAFDGSILGIWNEKNVLKSALAKEDLEKHFNSFIDKLSKGIVTKSDW